MWPSTQRSTTAGTERIGPSRRFFYENVVNAVAVDNQGRRAVLSGPKGLIVVDLDNVNDPHHIVSLPRVRETTQCGDVQCNPHAGRSSYVVSTASTNALLWDLSSKNAYEATLKCHKYRGAPGWADVCWSPHDQNLLASCAGTNSVVLLWDTRTPNRPQERGDLLRCRAWDFTLVSWNRVDANLLATAHEGDVYLWDLRVERALSFVVAHRSRVISLDWSYHDRHLFLSASHGTQVKFWGVADPPEVKAILSTPSPVLRARFTPFGYGVAVAGGSSVILWSLKDLSRSARPQFEDHDDRVVAFDWRIRTDSRDCQLVSCSKSKCLYLWTLPSDDLKTFERPPGSDLGQERPDMTVGRGNIRIQTSLSTGEHLSSYASQLALEFAEIPNHRLHPVRIILLDASKRECRVRCTAPAGAPPSFEMMMDSTCPLPKCVRVLKALQKLANKSVSTGSCCLVKILEMLPELLGNSPTVSKDVSLSEPRKVGSTSKLSVTQKSPEKSSERDDSMPCPSTSGAAFCPRGGLICFHLCHSFRRRAGAGPRTYTDLKAVLKASLSPQPRSGPSLPKGNTSFLSLTSWLYQAQEPPALAVASDISTSPTLVLKNAAPGSGTRSIVWMRDLSEYIPVSYKLGAMYTLKGTNAYDVCAFNAEVARLRRRSDLQRLWTMLGILTRPIPRPSFSGSWPCLGIIPWSKVPLGTELISSILRHLERIKDIQTLAMICCVLSIATPHVGSDMSLRKFLEKRQRKLSGYSLTSMPSSPMLPAEKIEKVERTNRVLPHHSKTVSLINMWSGRSSWRHSPPRFKKQTLSPVPDDSESWFLLDSSRVESFNMYRESYAQLLHRWGLFCQCQEVLSFLEPAPTVKNISLAFLPCCSSCGRHQEHLTCSECRTFGFKCAICRIVVRGLSNFCFKCGHGGHASHFQKWFESNEVCPAGCGCRCKTSLVSTDQNE